jgi:CheY-like chemotaxis protein
MSTILLADIGDVEIALDVVAALEDAGHRVIRLARTQDLDQVAVAHALILDLALPEADVARLRRWTVDREVPLIAVSSAPASAAQDERLARSWGALFLERPRRLSDLPPGGRGRVAGGATLPDILWVKVLLDLVSTALGGTRPQLDSFLETDAPSSRRGPGPDVPRDVLIVDDDELIRTTIAQILRFEGYTVAAAANGAEALRLMRGSAAPRLILLDLMMPVMNGWQLHHELRRDPALADIPVAVISAVVPYRERDSIDLFAFLKKPVNIDDLLGVVGRLIKARSSSSPESQRR